MVATLNHRISDRDVRLESTGADVEDQLLARLDLPAETDDPTVARRRRAEALAAIAGGDREALETLRAKLLGRLHRASDDFKATDDLRVVELALSLIPRPEGLWAWQERERTRKRRWWR